MRYLKAGIAAWIAMVVLSAAPVWADFQVIDSSLPDISQGTVLEDDSTVKLPEGATLKLLKTPEGSTHELEGPYEGPITDYEAKPDCSFWQRLMGNCPESSSPIGIRSMEPPPQ